MDQTAEEQFNLAVSAGVILIICCYLLAYFIMTS